jgi:Uncharacterised nucleotidyltransferase
MPGVEQLDLGEEERLLLDICATGIGRAPPGTASTRPVDWDRFAALASQHRVEPLVWRKLRLRSELELPATVALRLENADQRNALHCLTLTSCLVELADRLASDGITAIPLKGVCLAARYYDAVSSRHAGDIDLLVAPEDLARADRTLKEAGCVQISSKTHAAVSDSFVEDPNFVHHLSYLTRAGVPLEVHFRLNQNPALLPLRVSEIIACATTVRFGKTDLLAMPDDLQFLFLAIHGARHEWERLQWIYDIALMVHKASPGEVRAWIDLAKRYGVYNPAIQSLAMAHHLLGVAVPPEVAAARARSLRVRYMERRAMQVFLGQAQRNRDGGKGLDLPTRIYRLCMSSNPRYLWHEVSRGGRAYWGRLTRGIVRNGDQSERSVS